SHRTPMAPLYPGAVPDAELGPTLDYLRKAGVGYETSPRGGLIMVPEDKVEELRMQLRIQGIPKAAPNGSEMLDKPSFGDSSLKERAKFMMDLAVKVERQILMITPVQAVKVNVALPQQTDLIRRQAEPSASITVTLHPGRTLDRSQVAAITNIAAGTVPGLQAKNVTLMDQEGNWLTQPDSELRSDAIAQQRLQLRETEARLLKRVNEILEPYSKNQGADAKAAIRSTQSLEAAGVAQPQPTGVPGAASNQAPTPASAPATGASVPPLQAAQAGLTGTGARRENRTNYELDKTVEVKRQATGEIRRINVAVLVNHRSTPDAKTGKPVSAPLSTEEMDKLTALVQEAVGYKKDRGDSVRVVNIPFRAEPKAEPELLPVWKAHWLIDLLKAGCMHA
ncbi:MAG: flagellar M-ring protein FliF, partial [Burkholderiales bacterium PBB5]